MTPEAEVKALLRETKLLNDQSIILKEKQSLITRQDKLDNSEISVPDAYRQPVSFEDAGITKDEVSYVQDINQRELNQLEGKPTPYENYGNISVQSLAETTNKLFGGDTLSGNFVSPYEKLKAEGIQRRINAAESGIHTGGGVSWGAQAIGSLALTDQDKANVSRNYLTEKFGQEVKIGRDKQSGEMVYFDPEKKKMYPLNRLGMDGGDFAEMAGSLIVAIPETIGGVLGAVDKRRKGFASFTDKGFTSRQKKEISYAATGAAFGEFIRLTLGQEFGVNEDLSTTDKIKEAALAAGLTLGTGVAFEGVVSFVKRMREGLGTSVIPNDVLRKLTETFDNIDLSKAESGEVAIKAINEALYEAESQSMIKPLAGQVQDNTGLLDIVQSLKATGSDEKEIIMRQEFLNSQSQKEFFGLTNNQVTDVQPKGISQLGEDIRGVTDQRLASRRQEANTPLNAANRMSRTIDRKLPTTPQMDAALSAKAALTSEEKVFYDASNVAYTKLAEDAETIGIKPNTKPLVAGLSKLAKTDDESYVVGVTGIREILKPEVFDPETKWTLPYIDGTIKKLRVYKRAIDTGQKTADRGMVKKAISILNEFRVDALKDNPEFALRQMETDIAYSEGKKLFDTGTVQKILNDKDPLPESQLFDRIIVNGDSTTSKNVAEAITDSIENPEAMLKMKQGIYGFYKEMTTKNGITNLEQHNDFVKNYIDKKIITPFFKDSEIARLRSVGSIGKVVGIETKRQKASLARINGTGGKKGIFEKEISNLEAKTLFNRVWGEDKQANVRQLKKALENNPQVWKSYQAEVMDQIKQTIMTDGQFNADKLIGLINKRGGTISETLGEGYLKNLTLLKESLDVTNRQGKGFTINQSNALMDMGRAYVGVFTTPGRFLTATNRLRGAAAKKLITEIITDPEKTVKLHALRNARSGSDTARLLFAELGASELAINEKPEDKAYTRTISEQITWKKKQHKEASKRKSLIKQQEKAKKISDLKEQQQKYQAYTR